MWPPSTTPSSPWRWPLFHSKRSGILRSLSHLLQVYSQQWDNSSPMPHTLCHSCLLWPSVSIWPVLSLCKCYPMGLNSQLCFALRMVVRLESCCCGQQPATCLKLYPEPLVRNSAKPGLPWEGLMWPLCPTVAMGTVPVLQEAGRAVSCFEEGLSAVFLQ